MLKTRVLTALVAAPLLLALLIWGPTWGFPLFTVLLVGLALWEFYAMTRPGAPLWSQLAGIAVGAGVSAVWLFAPQPPWLQLMLTLGTLGLLLAHLPLAGEMDRAGGRLAASLAGVMYCAIPLTHLGLLYQLKGWKLVVLAMLFTFASDTGAYFTGRALGRHPFAPRVSPKKTWEGALGGLAFSVAACVAWRWVMPEIGVLDAVALGLGAGFMGQLGDLCESLIKRSAGVKDSGRILPGHGGVLDRFDAVAFTAPLLYYYYVLVIQAPPG